MSTARPADDTLEDLRDLDDSGVGATEAARRAGFPTAHAMEKWLERADEYPLWLRFRHRDPKGAHERKKKDRPVINIDPIIALLDRADESPKKAHGRKADRIRDLIKALRSDLENADRKAEAEAEARQEIERLEGELAEAKARLRKTPTATTVHATADAPAIRAWARANGVTCPERGRIPATVREAYDAEQATP